ncbi:MAG: ankyrin repeat domain-containing protein [bacterium]
MEQNEDRFISAAQEGDVQALKALLDASVNVNAKGSSGMTALMHAAKNNYVDSIKALLEAGADVNAANEFGRTALKMAGEKGYVEAVNLLQKAGAVDNSNTLLAAPGDRNRGRLDSIAEKYGIEDPAASGAKWFFLIAGLSLVNSLIVLFGGNLYFLVGLGITQFIDGFAIGMVNESGAEFRTVANTIAFLFDVGIAGVFVAFGVFARKRQKWSFITGMCLYAFDGLLFLLFKEFLALGFHLFILWKLYDGLESIDFGEAGEAKTASV